MKLKAKYFFLICILSIHSVLLFYFAFDSWLDCDEGQWAHVAERVAQGETLHTQIKEHHPDYIHYTNALALKIWGHDFRSLRYPLIIISLIQTACIFLTLYELGLLTAIIGSVCIGCFGFIHVLNPTPNLYALFFHLLIFCTLSIKSEKNIKYSSIGFLLASEFLFRQLSAVYTALAIYCCLTNENEDKKVTAKLIGNTLLIGLIFHSINISNWSGRFLFCLGPIIVLALSISSNTHFWKRSIFIALGFLLGLCPQLIDLLVKGNLTEWFQDVFIYSNSEINNFEGLKLRHYLLDILAGINGILNIHTFQAKINGIYLLFLPIIPLIQSLRTITLWKKLGENKKIKNLAIFACFFALVPAFNQVPLYLRSIVGLSLCSLVVTELTLNTKFKKVFLILSIYLCIVGLLFFAGESTNRSLNQSTKGEWIDLQQSTLKNINLNIEQKTIRKFSALQNKINTLSTENDKIVAMPFIPYLYFILNRKNPTPWIGLDYAELGGENRNLMLDKIKAENPKLLIFCSHCCSYIEKDEDYFKQWVESNYTFIDQVSGYKIYSPK